MHFRIREIGAISIFAAMLLPVNLAIAADLPGDTAPAKEHTKAVRFLETPFFFVNDNRLTYAYEFTSHAPGYPGNDAKQTVAYTHFDAWAYGTNFVSVLATKDNHNVPAAPCTKPDQGCSGALTFAGTIRSTLGFNEVFDTKAFSVGPLRNVSLELGTGEEVTNTFGELNIRHVVAGVQFALDLPYKGYVDIAPLLYKAWYYTSLLTPQVVGPHGGPGVPNGESDFRPTWAIEANYYMDLGFLPDYLPLAVSGRVAWIGSMGPAASSSLVPFAYLPPTKYQINSEPIRLTLDASKVFWGAKYSHFLDVWVAYKYRQNIVGLDHATAPQCIGNTCTVSTAYAGVTVKF